MITNSNWTEWSTIQGVILQVQCKFKIEGAESERPI